MRLRALIVDDELHARENLRYLLENYCPEIEVLALAAGPAEAQELIRALDPEVVFLDICMPSGTEGFELLEALPEKKFQVVFVTAFKDYAIRALNANAINYLQKPIDVEDLKSSVDKVVAADKLFTKDPRQKRNYVRSLENLSRTLAQPSAMSRITIQNAGGYEIVDQDDLMYLEGEGGHTAIVFRDGKRATDSKPIGVYENMLEPRVFFRIHKSHIVNLSCVKAVLNDNGHFVVMSNNKRLPVSRMRLQHFLDLYKENR